jgi:hypothetical protein
MLKANDPREVRLALSATRTSLSQVRVEAQRAEGAAVSLSRQRIAPNVKNVSVAEEIRALPNANAADALSRLPEGERDRLGLDLQALLSAGVLGAAPTGAGGGLGGGDGLEDDEYDPDNPF